jgi:CRISPR-associated exonuclease Cas4
MKVYHRIPDGKITYSDLNKPAKPFFSKKYILSGKPDYIVIQKNRFIPVEVKTGRHDKPQNNHIYQLAAYCHLLEENYGNFVPYGILIYNNSAQYKIPFNPQLRYELERTLQKMRQQIKTGKIILNHNNPIRCIKCSMKKYCNSKLI